MNHTRQAILFGLKNRFTVCNIFAGHRQHRRRGRGGEGGRYGSRQIAAHWDVPCRLTQCCTFSSDEIEVSRGADDHFRCN